MHGITLVRIDPSIGLLHITTQRPSPFLSLQTQFRFCPGDKKVIFGARKRSNESKSQSLLRDMHAPAGVIESRDHLRDGEINRKALAMAYIHRNGLARLEWRCQHRLDLEVRGRVPRERRVGVDRRGDV